MTISEDKVRVLCSFVYETGKWSPHANLCKFHYLPRVASCIPGGHSYWIYNSAEATFVLHSQNLLRRVFFKKDRAILFGINICTHNLEELVVIHGVSAAKGKIHLSLITIT